MNLFQCDFCSEGAGDDGVVYDVKEYISRPFEDTDNRAAQQITFHNTGAWIACHACSVLINADKWEELKERSVDYYIKNHPGSPRDVITIATAAMHADFIRERTTNAQPD